MIPTLRAHVGDLPIVAIGGIQIDNTNTIMQHGADGVSVISAIAQSSSVSNTVRQFYKLLNNI